MLHTSQQAGAPHLAGSAGALNLFGTQHLDFVALRSFLFCRRAINWGIHGGGTTSATRPTRMQPGSVRRAARTALGIVRAGDVGRDGHLAGHLAWAQWPSELEAVELACYAARSNTAVSAQYCTILRHWHNTKREQAYRPFFLLPLTACCSSAFLNILCRALCCAQLPLKHSCEQKKDPGMPSFLHLGHTILPGLVYPSDMQVGNSFFDSAMMMGGEQPRASAFSALVCAERVARDDRRSKERGSKMLGSIWDDPMTLAWLKEVAVQ